MKMSSPGDWSNRPRAREEVQKNKISSAIVVGTIFGIAVFVSIAALLVMFTAHIMRDAGIIDGSFSYRQAQLVTLCVYVIHSMFRFIYKRENTPTH